MDSFFKLASTRPLLVLLFRIKIDILKLTKSRQNPQVHAAGEEAPIEKVTIVGAAEIFDIGS